MSSIETISRRNLIKLMTIAGAAMCQPAALLAEVMPGQTTAATPGTATTTPTDPPPAAHESFLGKIFHHHHTVHPRLFYNAASVAHLRQVLAQDAAADADLKKSGDELLAAKLVSQSDAMHGEGQHANYGEPGEQMTQMGLTLGLLYQLTGDQRYADKLREAMLYYGGYIRWAGQNFGHRSPPWHSELDTAKFSVGYAIGYDALHSYLSEADRKTIADTMVRLSILPTLNDWVLPGKRIHSFDTMGHNWWGVCVAGAGLCTLALLGDDARAQGWIDAMDAGFEQWFNYSGNVLHNRVATFERSGPSYEGVNYTHYGVSEYLHYRLAWQNTYPGRKAAHMEPLDHMADFFLQTLYPTSTGSYSVNFNDSGVKADVSMTLLLLTACGLGTPQASRYLELVHTHQEGALFSLMRQYPGKPARTDEPTSCIYPNMGWAMMRSSWDYDATFMAMKSGYTWNHAHADAGSFILFTQGAPLIIDSGTCLYGRKEYSEYYCQSRAHNVILFDGAGQPADDHGSGCKFSGQMHSLIDGLGLKYVYADATGPMAHAFSRNYRHWIWSGEVVLIIDDIWAHAAGQLDWLLHYEGTQESNPDGSVHLKNGAAEATVKILHPATMMREDMGLAAHNPDKQMPYLAFATTTPMQTCQFITAICLNPKAAPTFELLEQPDYLGVRIRTGDSVEELHFNLLVLGNANTTDMRIGDWVTDAALLHLKYSAKDGQSVARFFVGDGSYLRQKDQSVLESLRKLTACWAPGEALEIFSDNASAIVQFGAEEAPDRVRWNGRTVAAKYDAQAKLVTVRS